MQSENINELATALCEAQKAIKNAHKDSANPFFKSKYADLTSTWEACRDALTVNGLAVVQSISTASTAVTTLETTLAHKSGQWITSSCPLINLKGDMQGLGSAISYARRYSLAAIVGVVADDDDGNAAGQADDKSMFDPKPRAVPTVPTPKTPGDYVCKVKKFAGKKLSEIKDFEILNYIDWLKKNTKLEFPEQKEFVAFGEAYLRLINPPPTEVTKQFDPEMQWNSK